MNKNELIVVIIITIAISFMSVLLVTIYPPEWMIGKQTIEKEITIYPTEKILYPLYHINEVSDDNSVWFSSGNVLEIGVNGTIIKFDNRQLGAYTNVTSYFDKRVTSGRKPYNINSNQSYVFIDDSTENIYINADALNLCFGNLTDHYHEVITVAFKGNLLSSASCSGDYTQIHREYDD